MLENLESIKCGDEIQPTIKINNEKLIGACQKYILNYSEELMVQYGSLTIKSTDLSEDEKNNMKLLQELLCHQNEICMKSLNDQFGKVLNNVLTWVEAKKTDEDWKGTEDKLKSYYQAINLFMVKNESQQRVAMLQSKIFLSQKYTDEPIQMVVVQNCMDFLKTLSIY